MDTQKQIDALKEVLVRLEKLDQSNSSVIAQINIIKTQITEYELDLVEEHIPFKTKTIILLKKSGTYFINGALIVCEVLNAFTSVFEGSNNQYLSAMRIVIPSLTIALKSIKQQ